jgi:hypothetical protein
MASFRSFQYLLQPTARQARALEYLLGVEPAPSKARSGGRRGMIAQIISSP